MTALMCVSGHGKALFRWSVRSCRVIFYKHNDFMWETSVLSDCLQTVCGFLGSILACVYIVMARVEHCRGLPCLPQSFVGKWKVQCVPLKPMSEPSCKIVHLILPLHLVYCDCWSVRWQFAFIGEGEVSWRCSWAGNSSCC